MRSNYHNRIRAAAWISTLGHVLLLFLAWWYRPDFMFGLGREPADSISITFVREPDVPDPAPRQPQRQLVDVVQPATRPVLPTDLIAVQSSNASDLAATAGDRPGPKVDEEATVDALGGRAGQQPTPPPAPPAPQASPARPDEAVEREMEPREAQAAREETAPQAPATEKSITIARADALAAPAPAATAAAPSAAAPAPPVPPGPIGNNRPEDTPTRGRRYSGVEKVGVQGFEALRSEIAPYLKQVEEAVERRWREALLTKYSGSRATRAEIDCEIAPDGRIVSLKINGTPDDRIYAALCKEAIEKAGPFGPFPFAVPDVYRNKNLEIRWSFNFS